MANSVNITGSDFGDLYNALDLVAKRSAQATRFMSRMFNTDFSEAKIFTALDKLNGKLAITEKLSTTAFKAMSAAGSVKQPVVVPKRPVDKIRARTEESSRNPFRKSPERPDDARELKPRTGALKELLRMAQSSQRVVSQVKDSHYQATQKIDVPESGLEGKASSFSRKLEKQEKQRQAEADKIAREAEKQQKQAAQALAASLRETERQQKQAAREAERQQRKLDQAARVAQREQDKLQAKLDRETAAQQRAEAKELQRAENRQRREEAARERDERRRAEKAAKDLALAEEKKAAIAAREAELFQSRYKSTLTQYERIRNKYNRAKALTNDVLNLNTPRAVKSLFNTNTWMSKFGNPGQMPLFTRFRVFQRPFPGSERNPFALGDASNVLNNAIYGATSLASRGFLTIVDAGSDVTRVFGNLTQAGLSLFSSLAKSIPYVGEFLAKFSDGLGIALKSVSEFASEIVGSLGKAVSDLMNALGMVALGIAGFASRAVQAASNLTELKNAAMVYVGEIGGRKIQEAASSYQQQYGLSAVDSIRLMTRIAGQYRQTTGSGQDEAAKQSQEIFKAAADAGSVLNMSLDDIGKTIQSALAGRYTPLRRIGVTVSAPYLDQLASAKGYTKDAKTPFEPRIRALIDEIKRQTTPFIKDLDATQYEFANLQRKFLGQFEAMFIHIGRAIEPFARVLLIATTTIGDKFLNKIRAFGDTIEQLLTDLKKGVGQAFGSKLYQYLAATAKGLARFADYIHYFGSLLITNFEPIKQAIAGFASKIVDLGIGLLDYSLKMIELAAGMIDSLGGVSGSIQAFSQALSGLAEWMDEHLSIGPKSKAKAEFARAESLVTEYQLFRKQLQSGQVRRDSPQGMRKQDTEKHYDAATTVRIKQFEKQMAQTEAMRQGVADLMQKGMSRDEAIYAYKGIKTNPLGGTGDISAKVSQAALSMREYLLKFRDNGLPGLTDSLKAPQKFDGQDFLNKLLQDIGRVPDFADIENVDGNNVSSRYFSPAAFYDEIATRELNAAETTAQNTGVIADGIKLISSKIAIIAEPKSIYDLAAFTTA